MSDDEILYEVHEPVATITLNRPKQLNGWTSTMDSGIKSALAEANSDRSVVGVIITGAGRAFCAGADMGLLADISSGSTEAAESSQDGTSADTSVASQPKQNRPEGDFTGRFPYLMTIDKPIIAAINGPVAGMAFPFSLCCDLRVGTPDSLFMTAFSQRGLIAEWGLSWLLPRLVGPGVAMDLLLSSRKVRGEEAYRMGLLNYLVAPEELLEFCRSYIVNLANSCSPASMAIMKRQVYENLHAGLGAEERSAAKLMRESFDRPDFAEGVKSFMEKRPPNFSRLGN